MDLIVILQTPVTRVPDARLTLLPSRLGGDWLEDWESVPYEPRTTERSATRILLTPQRQFER